MDDTAIIGTTNKKGQVITDPHVMMNDAPRTPSFFTGSEVIKEAVRRANVDVMVAYPITPQSEAAALCGELFAEGYIGDYFRGEREFAVMSQCAGAAFGGARVFTTIAREVGPTYIQAYTSCNIEYAIPTDQVMADAKTVEDDRYKFAEYVSEEAKAYLAERYGYKEYIQKPATVIAKA